MQVTVASKTKLSTIIITPEWDKKNGLFPENIPIKLQHYSALSSTSPPPACKTTTNDKQY
jgi:hypothetical protein